ncbi:MAG: hypothetical protein OES34_09755 [Nitrosopumilus sp.]|nr:hypothetical protein [Nitrosopumilus sp.]
MKSELSEVVTEKHGVVKMDADAIADMHASVLDINTDSGTWSIQQRLEAERIRYCFWSGQSPDGRKSKEYMDEEPLPFEGASDARIRLTDTIIRIFTAIFTAAALRGTARVKPVESGDSRAAGKMRTIWNWLMRNELRGQLRPAIKKVCSYMLGDSPGVGVLGVFWDQEYSVRGGKLTLEQIAEFLQEAFGDMREEQMVEFMDSLINPELEHRGVMLLMAFVPDKSADEYGDILRQFRETGEAKFTEKYLRVNAPRVEAFRMYESIYFRTGVSDIQRSSEIFTTEWLTEAGLRERVESEDYTEKFVTLVIEGENGQGGHKGASGFPEYWKHELNQVGKVQDRKTEGDDHENEYEIITRYFRAVNQDNVPAIYCVPFHHAIKEVTARDAELLDYAHGGYPFVIFTREVLTDSVMESRGVPEVSMTEQSSLKQLNDSFEDHTQLTTVPPLKRYGNRQRTRLILAPMGETEATRPGGRGDWEWAKPPEYPRTNDMHELRIWKRLSWYFGIPFSDQVPPEILQLLMQDAVDDFLDSTAQAFVMIVQLFQQYADDELLQRIAGGKGVPIARSLSEIEGQYDIELSFDIRDRDPEYLAGVGKLFGEIILPLDRDATVQTAPLVRHLVERFDPNLAEEALRTVEEASDQEVDEEQLNFIKIAAGIEPRMAETGENFALRLRTLHQILQQNPQAVEDMNEVSQALFQNRVKHLQFQVQQRENAQTGRVGTEPMLVQ